MSVKIIEVNMLKVIGKLRIAMFYTGKSFLSLRAL